MTDALSEALMKLSAAKPVSDRYAPATEAAAAAGAAAGDPERVVSAEASGRSVTTLQTAAAVIAEATVAPAESAAVCGTAVDYPPVGSGPSSGASPGPGPISAQGAVSMDAGTTGAGWILRVRELRGWVAAGIALALLFTVVDDLRNRGAAGPLEMVAGSGSGVDLDELLKDFETAEPASRPQRDEVVDTEPLPDTVSEVTANYGDDGMAPADERSVSGSGARVVRFVGRIEPLL